VEAGAQKTKFEYRPATNEDANAIALLVKANGCQLEIDWSDIGPHWWVAEDISQDNKIVACIQICHGKPIGRLEFLAISPEVKRKRERAALARDLIITASAMLKNYGAHMVMGAIDDQDQDFVTVLEKRGCRVVSTSNCMYARNI